MQYGENVFLKDFVFDGIDFIMEADAALGCNYLEKENSNMNGGILVVNRLSFYKRRLIYLANILY